MGKLTDAVIKDDLSAVKELLKTKYQRHTPRNKKEKASALIEAFCIKSGPNIKMIEVLIEAKADVNATMVDGETPLQVFRRLKRIPLCRQTQGHG